MIFPNDSSLCAQAGVFWSQRKNIWFAFTIRGNYTLFSPHLSREWHPRNTWIPIQTPGKSLLKTLLMRVFKQLTKMDLDFSVIKVVSNIWHIIFLEFHGDVSFLLKTKDEIIKNG